MVYVFTDKDVTAEKMARKERLSKMTKGMDRASREKIKEPLCPFPQEAKNWSESRKYAWNVWCELSSALKRILRHSYENKKIPNLGRGPMFAFEHNGKGEFTLHILQGWISERLELPPVISVTVNLSQEHHALNAYTLMVLKSMYKEEIKELPQIITAFMLTGK